MREIDFEGKHLNLGILRKMSHGIIPSLFRRKPNALQSWVALKNQYELQPNPETENKLRSLIGTSSEIDLVLRGLAQGFDSHFYLAQNPDIRKNGMNAELHYVMWGWKENRSPSRFFDANYYSARNRQMRPDEFPLAHYEREGRALDLPTNGIGSRIWFEPSAPGTDMWSHVTPAKRSLTTRAIVVLPVYRGYDETLTAIYQCLASRGDDDYSLLVINDNSPDHGLAQILEDLAAKGLFDYHVQHSNLGFVRTVNHALGNLTDDLDVVLLNSDAFVFNGWFRRLANHAGKDSNIATVTPLSNNATICSYPLYNKDNYIGLEISPQETDALASRVNANVNIDIPTGVGFCMYITRAALLSIGLLDENAFKLGYGEENDFCVRADKAGFKNILAGDVFVYHVGAVSFSEVREENYSTGQINLQKKHPDYLSRIERHFFADPEQGLRRRIDSARFVQYFKGATIYIAHKWSGGIETYIRDRIDRDNDKGEKAVILRVHDNFLVSFEDPSERPLFVPNLVNVDLRKLSQEIINIIDALEPKLLSVNSFAGLNWQAQKEMLSWLAELSHPKSYIIHDFSAISHHYQLIRPDLRPFSDPTAIELSSWDTMNIDSAIADVCSFTERQSAYRSFFASNVTVEAPSESTRHIFSRFFPQVTVSAVPHESHVPPSSKATRRPADGKIRIALLGAIGGHKGSDCVRAVSSFSRNAGLPLEFHLLGYSDNDETFEQAGVRVWGRYQTDEEALAKLLKIEPDLFWVPSIWPETFCYTLSLALSQKLPTIVFDLGAQRERVAGLSWTKTLPINLATDPERLASALCRIDLDALWMAAAGA